MKVKVPSKTVEVCDRCKRARDGGLLTVCVMCGREYCYACEAIMCGCVHQPDLCRDCGETDAAKAVVEKYAKRLARIVRQRVDALKAIAPNAGAVPRRGSDVGTSPLLAVSESGDKA